MSLRTTRNAKSVVAESTQLALAVPQVVAHRVARMANARPGLSAGDLREFNRMVAEKGVAFAQAWQAMATQTVIASQAMAFSFAGSFWSASRRGKITPAKVAAQLQDAALGVLGKGLAPVQRKATANARRLARSKRRQTSALSR
jgi:hypothetical protein